MLQIGRRPAVGSNNGHADLFQTRLYRRRIEGRGRRGLQLLHDRLGRAFRHEQRAPEIAVEIGEALLMRTWHVRQQRRALLGQHGERAHAVAGDLRHRGGGQRAEIVDAAGDQVLHQRAGAAIGDMGQVHLGRQLELRAGEMGAGADAGGAVLHLALVGVGVGDELLEVVDREVVARHQHQRLLDHQRDRRKIADRIVERFLIERLVLREGVDTTEHDLIAVGSGLGDTRRSSHAAGAADVLDHHLLAENLRQPRRQDAPHRIRRAARRERDHHGHGPRRPSLGRRLRGHDLRGKHGRSRDCRTQISEQDSEPTPIAHGRPFHETRIQIQVVCVRAERMQGPFHLPVQARGTAAVYLT